MTVEVFIHRPSTFGERYIGLQGATAILLILLYASFWEGHDVSGLLHFLLAYVGMCMIVRGCTLNLFDYVELERLESEFGLAFISVSQPTDNNPAGRMMRRTLANMASFYTEQQSVDVREGHARRVQEGWFVGGAPYGYRNVRREGRGLIEVDPDRAAAVRRVFHLYAYEPLTVDQLVERLAVDTSITAARCTTSSTGIRERG